MSAKKRGGGEVATIEEMAAIEFKPWSAAAVAMVADRLSANGWIGPTDPEVVALRIALTMMSKSKAEMIEVAASIAKDDPADMAELTAQFTQAANCFKALAKLLRAADARFMSACAVVALRPDAPAENGT